jgi:hypothetical protein
MQKIKLGFFLAIIATLISFSAQSQDYTLGKQPEEAAVTSPKKVYKIRLTRKQRLLLRHPKVKHSAQYEFYARVEKVAKEKQRMMRKMDKPQYSNFLYFGHKHLPKKHLPSQMRYCKECGLRH